MIHGSTDPRNLRNLITAHDHEETASHEIDEPLREDAAGREEEIKTSNCSGLVLAVNKE